MPKAKPKPKTPEPRVYERPAFFPPTAEEPLTEVERQRFRQMIADPVFQKVIRNAWRYRPPTTPLGTGESVRDQNALLIANNRLHQLQGWEMFEAAVFSQTEVKIKLNKKTPEETYTTL